uniref:Lipid-binding serum glycoprotein C-terminal domain-containing protein n=1 Tax=Meloidogyne incognita TaxID=6306 RepID=A0A914N3L1_MELIC
MIDKLQIEIGGGFIPWLINLFKTPLSNALKEALHDQFCQIVHSTILGQLNNFLISLPNTFDLGDLLFLNYAFDNDPQITSTFIESKLFTDVLAQNNSEICPFGPSTEMSVRESGIKWMASIWIHSSIPNCLLWSLHKSDILQITIGPNFASGRLKRFLQTSCHIYQICLGTFFPILAREYPDKHIDFHFHSMIPPTLKFISSKEYNENNILLEAEFFVDLLISPWQDNQNVLARLAANSTAIIEPFFENTRLKGNLINLQVKFSEVNSTIGNFSEQFLHKFSLVCIPILEVIFKSSFNIGIPLPSIEDIKLANGSKLTILPKDEQIRIDANLEYTLNNWILIKGRNI